MAQVTWTQRCRREQRGASERSLGGGRAHHGAGDEGLQLALEVAGQLREAVADDGEVRAGDRALAALDVEDYTVDARALHVCAAASLRLRKTQRELLHLQLAMKSVYAPTAVLLPRKSTERRPAGAKMEKAVEQDKRGDQWAKCQISGVAHRRSRCSSQ